MFIHFLCPFLNWILCVCYCMSFNIFLRLPLYQIHGLQIFFPFYWLPFYFVIVYFSVKELLVWGSLICWLLLCFCFWCHIQTLPRPVSKSFFPISLFSRSFLASDFMFKSLNHFELILAIVWNGVKFYFFVCGYPVFPTPSKKVILSQLSILGILVKY